MGRGRNGLLDQSRKKAKATFGLRGSRGGPGVHIFAPKREEKKIVINEDALDFMKNMDQKELANVLLSGDTNFSSDAPENIGDFISAPTCDPDLFILEYAEWGKEFEEAFDFEGKNRCPWYEGENGFCGKPCVGPVCFKHFLMGLAGHEPAPFNFSITN